MIDQLQLFVLAMDHELKSNEFKGHWLSDKETGEEYSDEHMVHELLYHAFKLARAVRQKEPKAVLHYAADVGNCAWFIGEKHEALKLDLLTGEPIEYTDETVASPQELNELKQQAGELAAQLLS